MHRSLLVVMGLALGCSSSSDGGQGSSSTSERSPGGPGAPRCTMVRSGIENVHNPTEVWLSRGPSRAVMVSGTLAGWGAFFWSLGGQTATLVEGGATPARAAWTGQRFLVPSQVNPQARGAARWTVTSLDARFEDPRTAPVELSPNASLVGVTELAGRALVHHVRPAARPSYAGTAWVQVVGPEGQSLGEPPCMLSSGRGGVERGARTEPACVRSGRGDLVMSVRARWDFGRAVVTTRGDDASPMSWVFDGDGHLLGARSVAHAACPRSGCVYVEASDSASAQRSPEQPSPTAPENNVRVLRVAWWTTHETVLSPAVEIESVAGLAVSGDKVLVLYRSTTRAQGCNLAVVDVGRAEWIPLQDTSELSCDPTDLAANEARVRPTPRGFVVASIGRLRDVAGTDDPPTAVLRTIDCVR